MKGWLLVETLLALLVANALVWFVVALRSTSDVSRLAHNLGRQDDSL